MEKILANQSSQQPLFSLGQVYATPGAIAALEESEENPLSYLTRHVSGDWGELSDEDKAENDFSVANGYRILSSYRTANGVKFWIITEWDRSVTTLLLPSEY